MVLRKEVNEDTVIDFVVAVVVVSDVVDFFFFVVSDVAYVLERLRFCSVKQTNTYTHRKNT